MGLVSVAEVRALVKTNKADADLQAIIDREDAAIVRYCGPHYVDATTSFTKRFYGTGEGSLFLPQRILAVETVTEDGVLLDPAEDYRVWSDQGRVQRLPVGWYWGDVVDVKYVPQDDREERKAVIIELVRLALEHTAMKSESIAGEYNYSAPDWEVERAALIRRISFAEV